MRFRGFLRHEGRAAPRLGEHGAGEAWIRCRLGGHGEILRARLGGEAVVGCGIGKGRGEVCTYSGGGGFVREGLVYIVLRLSRYMVA